MLFYMRYLVIALLVSPAFAVGFETLDTHCADPIFVRGTITGNSSSCSSGSFTANAQAFAGPDFFAEVDLQSSSGTGAGGGFAEGVASLWTAGPVRVGVAQIYVNATGIFAGCCGPLAEQVVIGIGPLSWDLSGTTRYGPQLRYTTPFTLGTPFLVHVLASFQEIGDPSVSEGQPFGGVIEADGSIRLFEADGVTPVGINDVLPTPEPSSIGLVISSLIVFAAFSFCRYRLPHLGRRDAS